MSPIRRKWINKDLFSFDKNTHSDSNISSRLSHCDLMIYWLDTLNVNHAIFDAFIHFVNCLLVEIIFNPFVDLIIFREPFVATNISSSSLKSILGTVPYPVRTQIFNFINQFEAKKTLYWTGFCNIDSILAFPGKAMAEPKIRKIIRNIFKCQLYLNCFLLKTWLYMMAWINYKSDESTVLVWF